MEIEPIFTPSILDNKADVQVNNEFTDQFVKAEAKLLKQKYYCSGAVLPCDKVTNVYKKKIENVNIQILKSVANKVKNEISDDEEIFRVAKVEELNI